MTQKQKVFLVLQCNKRKYLPAWQFVGETYIKGQYLFMSYKCPARLSDIFNQNPGLLSRRLVTGKSGAKYYEYKIEDMSKLVDKKLLYEV